MDQMLTVSYKPSAYEYFVFSINLAEGVVCAIGGYIGFKKAQSKISLIVGFLFGLLLITGAIVGIASWSIWTGLMLDSISSALLALFFSYRFYKLGTALPSLALALMAVIVTIFSFVAVFIRAAKGL